MTTEKMVPQTVESEEAFLGSILIDPAMLLRVSALRSSDFYLQKNAWTYEAITALAGRSAPIDVVTVCEELERQGRLDGLGGMAYVAGLLEAVPSSLHSEAYAQAIIVASVRRGLIDDATQIAKLAYREDQELETTLESVDRLITARLLRQAADGKRLASDVAVEALKLAEMYIADPLKVGETRWLNTGWMEMNRVLGGWQPGLHIVLGASHMGKSYFLQHAVANVADNGGRAAVYSLEMASSEIMTRMALATARTTKYRFERGDISDDQRGSLVDRLAQMHDWDVVFDDRAESLQSIISGIRGEFRKAALDLVVIDYLGLIEGVEADNRNLSLGIITRRLKLLSRELSIPVIVAHQISDKIIERRSNKRPTAADAYESGHVKQDADTVLGLYRDDVYNRDTETPHIMEVRVLKDRLGGNTGKVAMLYFDQFGQMLDAATNSEYEPQADDAPEWTKQTGAGFNL